MKNNVSDNELPSRKKNRLVNYDYSLNGAYFITICTKDRQHLFWNNTRNFVGVDAHIDPSLNNNSIPLNHIGKTVKKYISNIEGINKYVIMPNHIHLIILIDNPNVIQHNSGSMWASTPTQTVSQRIKSFKILVTKEIGFSPWQRSFYDRIIRNEEEYTAFWNYIENNPVNWENDELFKIEK